MGCMTEVTLVVYSLSFPLRENFQVAAHAPKNIQTAKAISEWADVNIPTGINVSFITNWTVNRMKVIQVNTSHETREKGEKA